MHSLWEREETISHEVQPVLYPALHQRLVREEPEGGGACIVTEASRNKDGGGQADVHYI